jgi:aarF domain-containing kinase
MWRRRHSLGTEQGSEARGGGGCYHDLAAMNGPVLLLLLAAAAIVALTVAPPTLRRVWAFNLYLFKYLALLLLEIVRVRRLAARLRGRPHQPLTLPVVARLFSEDMGPTYIKFAQIVASSSGMFPKRYVEEFQKCLDRVRPFSFAEVEAILTEELGEERAAELTDLDPVPLASASIAQVHTARLADGTEVVIKVQRPGIEARIEADMKILGFWARVAARFNRDARLANPVAIVEDFAATLAEEVDFQIEARHLARFNEIMGELGHADIRAPVPHWGYTTRRVLVMERFRGIRVDQVDKIRARGIDAEGALVKGIRAWFQSVIFYGFFHGDVHAGNLMLLDDGSLGFLDFGIVGRFDDRQRALVTDYMVAFTTGNYRRLAEVVVEMGGAPSGLDLDHFAAALKETYAPLLGMRFGDINYADLIPRLYQVAREHRMSMPKEFVLITKQMLYFDRYAKELAPDLNVFTDPRLVTSLLADIRRAMDERARA